MNELDLANTHTRAVWEDLGGTINPENDVLMMPVRSTKGLHYETAYIGGSEVRLPTYENMEDGGDLIIMHPISETMSKGEPATLKVLKNQANTFLHLRMTSLLFGIGELILDGREDDKPLTVKQRNFINANPDYNATTHGYTKALVRSCLRSSAKLALLAIHLHPDKELKGKKYRRVATVVSPLYDELACGMKEVWGKAVPMTHQKAILKLLGQILAGIDEDEFSYGGNNGVAPYYEALLSGYLQISERLDEVEKIFRSAFTDKLRLHVPTYTWVNDLVDLSVLRRAVPPLRGNIGNDVVGGSAFDVGQHKKVQIKENVPSQQADAAPLPTGEVVVQDGAEEELIFPMGGGSVANTMPVQQPIQQGFAPQQQQAPTHYTQTQQPPQQNFQPQQLGFQQPPQQATHYTQMQNQAPQQQFVQQNTAPLFPCG